VPAAAIPAWEVALVRRDRLRLHGCGEGIVSSPKQILVVDDNALNLKLMTFLLSSGDYELRTAVNARDALACIEAALPDLLLLDLQLPDMDGLALARQLKLDARTRGMPIIAVTAHAMKGDEEQARAAGVDGYISKPVARDAFRRAVADMLRGG
jgi:two-component system cell cycle response regulator DivK